MGDGWVTAAHQTAIAAGAAGRGLPHGFYQGLQQQGILQHGNKQRMGMWALLMSIAEEVWPLLCGMNQADAGMLG
jgi:hypothetical protein